MPKKIPILAVGPLGISPKSFSNSFSVDGLKNSDDVEIMRWLDQQPAASVVYIGFGTTGMRNQSKQHVFNLAQGLDASNQRFVWVLRAPPDVEDCAQAFSPGFEDRVKGRALLLRGWAPQKRILAHSSTGAFLSSCGWNSALESLYYGVSIIGWPSYADQPAVCIFTADLLGVTLPLPLQGNALAKPEAISSAVTLMLQSEQGKAIRDTAKKCGATIVEALCEGGTSPQAVSEFVNHIRARTKTN